LPGDVSICFLTGLKIPGFHVVIDHFIQGPTPQPSHEGLGRIQGNDPSFVQKGHPLGQKLRFLDVMGGEEDRGSTLLNPLDEGPDFPPDGGVQPDGGFVQKEDPGRMHESSGDHDPSAHSAREVLHGAVLPIAHADVFEEFLDSGSSTFSGHPKKPAVDFEVFTNGEFLVQVDGLGHQAALALSLEAIPEDVKPVKIGVPRGRAGKTGQDPNGGGFSGSVRSQIGKQLALPNMETDSLERLDVFVVLGEVLDANHL